MKKIPKNIYFGGANWAGAFYIGVVTAMQEEWGLDFVDNCIISGDSSGAIIGLCLALKVPAKELLKVYSEFSKEVSKKTIIGRQTKYNEIFFSKLINRDENTYKKLKGRLKIGVTHFYNKHVEYDSWSSNRDLIDCLHGSCHIPIYCGKINKVNNRRALDGTVARKKLPENALCVCIFNNFNTEITNYPSLSHRQCSKPFVGKEFLKLVRNGIFAFEEWDGKINKKKETRINNILLSFGWSSKLLSENAVYIGSSLGILGMKYLTKKFQSK